MKLVNMKDEPEKKEAAECCAMKPDQPAYPWGLRINLDSKALAKLGIKELPAVGSKLSIDAVVEVIGISINESSLYGDNRSMELQITDMSLGGMAGGEEEDKD